MRGRGDTRSYIWSANVYGKKKWPQQVNLLIDRHGQLLAQYSIRQMNMKNAVYNIFDDISETKFTGFKKLASPSRASKCYLAGCTQDHNGIIFVPSGWYHQVHNLADINTVIHEEEDWNCTMKQVLDLLMADFEKYGSQICSPKDLITFIDYAVSKLSSNCNEQVIQAKLVEWKCMHYSRKLGLDKLFVVLPRINIDTFHS
ncbi:hypothetical protein V6N13_041950 [Hibiscus sabdariffa]